MKHLYIFSLLASMFAITACSSTNLPYKEEVSVDSMLPGANVYMDGELVGVTPCTLTLTINSIHELKFEKEGFDSCTYTLTPTPVDSFVKFGVLVDTGYYRTLSPSSVYAEMKPDLLPAKVGEDAFDSFTENYIKLDALKKFGKISQEEYDYIVNYMTKFYSKEIK